MSTWEQRMAARAAERTALVNPWPPPKVLRDMAENPWRYSSEPPGPAPCCTTWRHDCHLSDDPPIDRYMWVVTCGHYLGDDNSCDHEHHRDEIWLA